MKKYILFLLLCASTALGQYKFGSINPWIDSLWLKQLEFQPQNVNQLRFIKVIFHDQDNGGYPYIYFLNANPGDTLGIGMGNLSAFKVDPGILDLSKGKTSFDPGKNGVIWYDPTSQRLQASTVDAGRLGYVDVAYRRYKATLTQSGTAAPVATVLQNFLGGTLVWTRAATGDFRGTLSGKFPTAEKVFLLIQKSDPIGVNQVLIQRFDANTIRIVTVNNVEAPTDGILFNTSVWIEVYP